MGPAITIVVVAVPDLEPFLLMVTGITVLRDEVAAIEMTERMIGNENANVIAIEIEIGTGKEIEVDGNEKVGVIVLASLVARAHSSMRMNVTAALCLSSNWLHV